MNEFSADRYVAYLRARYRIVVIATFLAAAIAIAVSFALPKQYTSTASIVIDLPAGADPRTATAVSPVYLESLRTYEQYALGDSLFERAMDHFHLTGSAAALKRKILKVTKIRDTRILQISVTLPDAKQSQAMAQFLAEQTVNLTRTMDGASDSGVSEHYRQQLDTAESRLKTAQAEWENNAGREPVESLQNEVESQNELHSRIARESIDTKSEIAEYAEREKFLATAKDATSEADLRSVRAALAGARVRDKVIEEQMREIERQIEARGALLSKRLAHRGALEAQLRSARDNKDAAERQLRETSGLGVYHGERLTVIDPGVEPHNPSAPNKLLNVVAAVLVAWMVSLLCLTFAFSLKAAGKGELD